MIFREYGRGWWKEVRIEYENCKSILAIEKKHQKHVISIPFLPLNSPLVGLKLNEKENVEKNGKKGGKNHRRKGENVFYEADSGEENINT